MKNLGNKDCQFYCGDCREILKKLLEKSIDLIVTDPPYGLSFMGKDWDKAVPSVKIWEECLRVLKDGAFAFIMSSPRLDCLGEMSRRLQEAGFNIGFTPFYWTYATGFPKAMNIGKAVDKKLGAEREVIGKKIRGDVEEAKKRGTTFTQAKANRNNKAIFGYGIENITLSATPQAKALDGSYAGFQPKPAVEVIIVAMKPLSTKTYVAQALKNRKGITWLNDCKIPYESEPKNKSRKNKNTESILKKGFEGNPKEIKIDLKGRFPANLLVSDDVLNDGKIRKSPSGKVQRQPRKAQVFTNKNCGFKSENLTDSGFGDSGSYSRYFSLDAWWEKKLKELPEEVRKTFPFLIVPKASKSEKNRELVDMPKKEMYCKGGNSLRCFGNDKPRENNPKGLKPQLRANYHPCVKPIKLMSYLITLGSRKDDLILDPFAGAGTTGLVAQQLGRRSILIELNCGYCDIIINRLHLSNESISMKKDWIKE